MSDYLTVEEYRVHLWRDAKNADAIVWVRQGKEWELGGENIPTIVAEAQASNEGGPTALFRRLVETLEAERFQLRTCGTCTHFRRDPQPGQAHGWRGFCNYTAPEAFAAGAGPGVVTLLAPDCHHYSYREGEAATAKAVPGVAPEESRLPDPETTLPLRTRGEEPKGLLGTIRRFFAPKKEEAPLIPTGIIERPGGQPCPSCGTRMTNRASIANATPEGDERIFSVWRCPHCYGNYLDDWFEAYVGSKARDAERLYVVPPSEADVGVEKVAECPRPDVKGCTCVSNQWFGEWGDRLKQEGRRMQHRESVMDI